MRYFRRYIFLWVILFISIAPALAVSTDWQTVKSTHFIVYYRQAPEKFLSQVVSYAEDYYNKIADDLGFRRYNFWLWDNRAKIYIYDNAKEYQAATGQAGWSAGCAMAQEKMIHSYPEAKGFFNTILPHEMGHIIFREFVGFGNSAVPLWLDEGVASYQENLKQASAGRIIKDALTDNKFMGLGQLAVLNPALIQDEEAVGLFYAEAVSLINFLVKEFGKDRFVLFCQKLKDQKQLEKAVASAYQFNNMQELDQAWQKSLRK